MELVQKAVIDTIERVCPAGEHERCTFGFCVINHRCARPHFFHDEGFEHAPAEREKEKQAVRPLRSNASGWVFRRLRVILGQSIFKHELVRDDKDLEGRIRQCTSVGSVVKLLEAAHNKKHGKSISLPGQGRQHYRKYFYENHPEYKAPQPLPRQIIPLQW